MGCSLEVYAVSAVPGEWAGKDLSRWAVRSPELGSAKGGERGEQACDRNIQSSSMHPAHA